jgi:uncharacterized protein (TIGR04255 family)
LFGVLAANRTRLLGTWRSVAIHYENAPITEALIDIRVDLPASVTQLQALESVHDQVKSKYPGKKKGIQVFGQFSGGDAVGASASQTLTGFAFNSDDGKQIIQSRRDGFTFSRLRPYGSWPELRDEARRLWDVYRSTLKPERITRVAVRYVNQIDIPLPTIDYKDYFRTTPEVSPVLPQGLSNFFMQLQFPLPDLGGLLILTETAVPPPNPTTTSVILDLDVFKQAEMADDTEIWELLESLRDKKNEFFEGCVTERTRALFGQRREY